MTFFSSKTFVDSEFQIGGWQSCDELTNRINISFDSISGGFIFQNFGFLKKSTCILSRKIVINVESLLEFECIQLILTWLSTFESWPAGFSTRVFAIIGNYSLVVFWDHPILLQQMNKTLELSRKLDKV